jgi:hypothetical protein
MNLPRSSRVGGPVVVVLSLGLSMLGVLMFTPVCLTRTSYAAAILGEGRKHV